MPVPAPRRRPSAPTYGPSGQQAQTSPIADIGKQLLAAFGQTLGGMMSPEQMFQAEAAPVRRVFGEARERAGSRIAALAPGNVRAIKETEEGLASRESEALGQIRARTGQQALSGQLMGVQLLEALKKLLGPISQQGAGAAIYPRP